MLHPLVLCSILLALFTPQALASTWSTSSHMGYAVNRQSSTGFAKIGGSMAYFDANHPLSGPFDLGLRTIAQGSRAQDLEFYRLGSGPVLGWAPTRGWRVEVSMAFFRESGLSPNGQKIYKSRGQMFTCGWERIRPLGQRVSWSYGGFFMAHRGDLDLGSEQPTSMLSAQLATQKNHGISQGAQVAIRIQLDE